MLHELLWDKGTDNFMYAVLKLMINMFIQILGTEFYFSKNNKRNPYPITVTDLDKAFSV